jgi:hypothetical protein
MVPEMAKQDRHVWLHPSLGPAHFTSLQNLGVGALGGVRVGWGWEGVVNK